MDKWLKDLDLFEILASFFALVFIGFISNIFKKKKPEERDTYEEPLDTSSTSYENETYDYQYKDMPTNKTSSGYPVYKKSGNMYNNRAYQTRSKEDNPIFIKTTSPMDMTRKSILFIAIFFIIMAIIVYFTGKVPDIVKYLFQNI